MFSDQDFQKKYQRQCIAHHMVAISNLQSIFRSGHLKSYNEMKSQAIAYESLANDEVQVGRANITVPGGKPLHDYVPLYLTFKTPMSACNQSKNKEWVYLTFNLCRLATEVSDLVITDGNARTSTTRFQKLTQLSDFDIVNWPALKSTRWAGNLEMKRQRQAEVLVPGRLSMDYLLWISTVDDVTRDAVNQILAALTPIKAATREGWFFI